MADWVTNQNNTQRKPRRYFTLGLVCCYMGGLVFLAGIILTVWGSSPFEPLYLWIVGLVLLCTGGLLFFLGIGSIGLYLKWEDDTRKQELAYLHSSNATTSNQQSQNHQNHSVQNQNQHQQIDLTDFRPTSRLYHYNPTSHLSQSEYAHLNGNLQHSNGVVGGGLKPREIDTDDMAHMNHAHWNIWRTSPLPADALNGYH